jgi:hypothetical protein
MTYSDKKWLSSAYRKYMKKSSNQLIIGGTHLQYVYKHCAKFE